MRKFIGPIVFAAVLAAGLLFFPPPDPAWAVSLPVPYTVVKNVLIDNPQVVDMFAKGVQVACSDIDTKAETSSGTCAGHMATPTVGSKICVEAIDTDTDGVADKALATATFFIPSSVTADSPP